MTLDENGFGPPHRVVEAADWHATFADLRAEGYTYFDWLSAVDEEAEGFRLVAHLLRLDPWDHLLVATLIGREDAAVESVTDVFAGAAWHERETHEMFGIAFDDAAREPLLLPDGFEGHPLRKDFVLASRVVKAWPGAKEPGESDHDVAGKSPGRRRMKPPGVPDDWLQDDSAGVPGHGRTDDSAGVPGHGRTDDSAGVPGHGRTDDSAGVPGHGRTDDSAGVPGHGRTDHAD